MSRKLTKEQKQRLLTLVDFLDEFRCEGAECVFFGALYEDPNADDGWTLGKELSDLRAELTRAPLVK